MRASLPILLAILAIAAAPLPARSAPVAALVPPAAEARPGDVITTAIPELAPGTREFELVLIPEQGPAIQVTAEQRAGVRSVTWRMPRTFAGRARLALRVGDARSEAALAPSAWFALAPSCAEDLVHLVTAGGEDDSRFFAGPVAAALAGPQPAAEFGAAWALPSAVPAPASPGIAVAANVSARLFACEAPRVAPAASNLGSTRPVRSPLRI